MNWDILVNPLACAGGAGRHWPSVKEQLLAEGFSFTSHFTESPENTRSIIGDLVASGSEAVAVYGGDGTLSDTASVLSAHSSPPALAVLPAGSGNDWARSIGLHHPDIPSALSVMRSFSVKNIDTAEAAWETGSRIFLNSCGIGLDAIVLHRALALRRVVRLPKLSYMLSLAGSSVVPPVLRGRFLSDGKEFYSGPFVTFTTGVGRYSGGGMQLSPAARPDDGLLDGLCLTSMGFFTILRNLGRVFDGTLHRTRWARNGRGKVIRFENAGTEELLMELDGEPVDMGKSSWLEVRIRPSTIRVVVPSGSD